MRRYFSRIFICLFMLTLLVTNTASADGESQIKMNIDVGFNGTYKFNQSVPMNIEVTNNMKDINGELQVEIENERNNITIYSMKVNISKGSTKKFTINVPISKPTNLIYVKIMEGKEQLHREFTRVSYGANPTNTFLIGFLSDDYDSVNYFTHPVQYTQTAKLDEKNFSEDIDVMKMFDAIVINNFDTSKLNKAQYNTLKRWVEDGGLLIVGTGPSHAKTLSLFKDDFISGQIGNVTDIDTKALYNLMGKTSASTMKTSVLSMSINNSVPLLKENNFTFIHSVNKGAGNIIISAFDFGLKPVVDWDLNRAFTGKIIEKFIKANYQNEKEAMMSNNYYMINDALRVIPDLPLPKPRNFLIIFAVYIILVGPVSYIVLKKRDKRELMWITVPVLSLIFSGIMFISGLGTRLNKPIANIISLIDVTENQSANVKSFASIFTPVKSTVKIEAAEGMSIKPFMGMDYYYRGDMNNNTKVVDSKVIVSPKTSVEFYKNGVWSSRTISLNNKDFVIGSIESQLNYGNNFISGSIKNNTGLDIEESYIIAPEQYIKIGPVKKGETKTIKERVSSFNGDVYSMLSALFPDVNSGRSYQYTSDDNKIKEFRSNRQKNQMLNYFFTSQGFRNDGVKIVAISSTPINKDIIVNGDKVTKYEKTMITSEANMTFRNGKTAEYPFGVISPYSVSSTLPGYDAYGKNYFGRGTLEVAFKIDGDVIPENISIKYNIGKNPNSNSVNEYLWNYKTSTWDVGNYSSYSMSRENISKYVDSNNVMKIKVESTDDSLNMQLPRIYVKGSVK